MQKGTYKDNREWTHYKSLRNQHWPKFQKTPYQKFIFLDTKFLCYFFFPLLVSLKKEVNKYSAYLILI